MMIFNLDQGFRKSQLITRRTDRASSMKPTIALLVFATSAWASSGDRSLAFHNCLVQRTLRCTGSTSLPLSLRLTGWSCEDECKYQCAHLMTDVAISKRQRIEQFYGKWAFWRWLGMQEPASVFFSLLNLWAHVRGGKKIKRRISKHHPMRAFYVAFTYINLNTWIWSAIFHTRGMSHDTSRKISNLIPFNQTNLLQSAWTISQLDLA
jgi:hypothetical protein